MADIGQEFSFCPVGRFRSFFGFFQGELGLFAIADIHGNLPALEAVLEDAQLAAVDSIWNLGDLLWTKYDEQW